jgi:hypothetical protein
MLRRKYIFPVAVLAGVFHLFFWLDFAGVLMAMGTSVLYALLVYWSYRHLESK